MVVVALLASIAVGQAQLGPGQQVPDVTLLNMKGESVSLSQFHGKKLVLFNWASW
ncbi:MAG: redoxin family protein [Armatimonadetes bacterium]|nr:redoxin family protein [Armatimonadota bacterium]